MWKLLGKVFPILLKVSAIVIIITTNALYMNQSWLAYPCTPTVDASGATTGYSIPQEVKTIMNQIVIINLVCGSILFALSIKDTLFVLRGFA